MLDFDKCDFPIPYSKPSLAHRWFDFNDSTVRAIYPGSLQGMFGGSSANAYMLVYRQKKLNAVQKPIVPEYWKTAVEALNESNEA